MSRSSSFTAYSFQEGDQVCDLFDFSPYNLRPQASLAVLVDDQNSIVETGSKFGVFPATDGNVGADVIPLFDVLPPRRKPGRIHRHAAPDNRHQAPVRLQALQGLFDMQRPHFQLFLAGQIHIRRKRGVHHDDGGPNFGGQDCVQVIGVFVEDPNAGNLAQQRIAPFRQFIGKNRGRAGQFGMGDQIAGASGRLQYPIGRLDSGDPGDYMGMQLRRRKLLHLLLFGIAAGLGRQAILQRFQIAQSGPHGLAIRSA